MKKVSAEIQNRISLTGNSQKAKWLENYVKHEIKSKGVGIPEIRQIITDAAGEYKLTGKSMEEQAELLSDLMASAYTEDKLSAILYIQLFWKGKNAGETIDLISGWFDKGFISDWNVCDWLCVRILTPLLDAFTNETVAELKKWNKNKNLWKARASLVPFAQSKTIHKHIDIIREFSAELIRREERFCKTAVGWVLREYSKIDPLFVTTFLGEYENLTTKEVIRNATKYIK